MDEASTAFSQHEDYYHEEEEEHSSQAEQHREASDLFGEEEDGSWNQVEAPDPDSMMEEQQHEHEQQQEQVFVVEEVKEHQHGDDHPAEDDALFPGRVDATEDDDSNDQTKPAAIEPPTNKMTAATATATSTTSITSIVVAPIATSTPPTDKPTEAAASPPNTINPPSPVASPTTLMQSTTETPLQFRMPQFSLESGTTPSSPRLSVTPLKLALPPTSSDDPNHTDASDSNTNNNAFAQVIRERTRQRRAREDAAVSELRVQVSRLEAALQAESKRRVTAVQQIHHRSVQAVAEMEARLQTQVQDETERVHARLTILEERCRALEQRWQADVTRVEETTQHTQQQLRAQLAALQQAAAAERPQRASREQRLRAQMEEVSERYQERWKQERQDRMADLGTLRETMESVHHTRQTDVATFEGRLTRALGELRVAVDREQQERHASDEDIVDALNRYSKQLQESLAAASGAAYY